LRRFTENQFKSEAEPIAEKKKSKKK